MCASCRVRAQYRQSSVYEYYHIQVVFEGLSLLDLFSPLRFKLTIHSAGARYAEMALRITSILVTCCVLVAFCRSLRRLPRAEVLREQLWIAAMLALLAFLQDPFFAPLMLHQTRDLWVMSGLVTLTAKSALLVFWLLLIQSISGRGPRGCCSFYWDKLLFWLLLEAAYVAYSFYRPFYQSDRLFAFAVAALAVVVSVWAVAMLRLISLSHSALRRLPYVTTRFRQLSFRFFLLQTAAVLLYLVIKSVVDEVSAPRGVGTYWGSLSQLVLVSVYLYLIAFIYSPAHHPVNLATFFAFFLPRAAAAQSPRSAGGSAWERAEYDFVEDAEGTGGRSRSAETAADVPASASGERNRGTRQWRHTPAFSGLAWSARAPHPTVARSYASERAVLSPAADADADVWAAVVAAPRSRRHSLCAPSSLPPPESLEFSADADAAVTREALRERRREAEATDASWSQFGHPVSDRTLYPTSPLGYLVRHFPAPAPTSVAADREPRPRRPQPQPSHTHTDTDLPGRSAAAGHSPNRSPNHSPAFWGSHSLVHPHSLTARLDSGAPPPGSAFPLAINVTRGPDSDSEPSQVTRSAGDGRRDSADSADLADSAAADAYGAAAECGVGVKCAIRVFPDFSLQTAAFLILPGHG